jgi:glucose-6-phosphate isomerase
MLRAVRHAVVVNPDPHLRRIAGEEGWEVLHLDRLGRRLKVLAALGAGTALASLGRVVREHSDGARANTSRAARGGSRTLQSRASGRRAGSRRTRERRGR